MIQITPQMRILVSTKPVDFRKGIDGLRSICTEEIKMDPFSGAVFVFRNRPATSVKILIYDGQGFWLCQKRLSKGRFAYWPSKPTGRIDRLESHQLAVLLSGGNPAMAQGVRSWRELPPNR